MLARYSYECFGFLDFSIWNRKIFRNFRFCDVFDAFVSNQKMSHNQRKIEASIGAKALLCIHQNKFFWSKVGPKLVSSFFDQNSPNFFQAWFSLAFWESFKLQNQPSIHSKFHIWLILTWKFIHSPTTDPVYHSSNSWIFSFYSFIHVKIYSLIHRSFARAMNSSVRKLFIYLLENKLTLLLIPLTLFTQLTFSKR